MVLFAQGKYEEAAKLTQNMLSLLRPVLDASTPTQAPGDGLHAHNQYAESLFLAHELENALNNLEVQKGITDEISNASRPKYGGGCVAQVLEMAKTQVRRWWFDI